MQGHRNAPSQPLYSVSLPTHPPSIQKSNATINVSSIWYQISFYHSALFYPKISTWCKSIKNGFLQYCPELTINQVTKYTPISEVTFKGHMHEQRSNIYSTKKAPLNKNMDTNISTPSPIHNISKNKESYEVIQQQHSNRHTYPLLIVIFFVITINTRFA